MEQIDMVDSVNGMPSACAARQPRLLAEDRRLGAAAGDVVQDALAQRDALEVGAVGAQRLLGIGAGFAVIDERPRHLAVVGLP